MHCVAAPEPHTPPLQYSFAVQALVSSQGVRAGVSGSVQVPVDGSQTPC